MTDKTTNNSDKEGMKLDEDREEKIKRLTEEVKKEGQEQIQILEEVYKRGSPEEIHRVSKELEKKRAESELKWAKTYFEMTLDIFCEEEPTNDQHHNDLLAESTALNLMFLIHAEGRVERLSKSPYGIEGKRPSELSSEDIHVPQIPQDLAPREILRQVKEKLYDRELDSDYVDDFLAQCHKANWILNEIIDQIYYGTKEDTSFKPTVEECDSMANDLKLAYKDILVPRCVLARLKGCELPTFSSKKVDQKDAAKLFEQIKDDAEKAQDYIREADDWRDSEEADQSFKPFAKYLDQALDAIADADAALKCYQTSLEEKK